MVANEQRQECVSSLMQFLLDFKITLATITKSKHYLPSAFYGIIEILLYNYIINRYCNTEVTFVIYQESSASKPAIKDYKNL